MALERFVYSSVCPNLDLIERSFNTSEFTPTGSINCKNGDVYLPDDYENWLLLSGRKKTNSSTILPPMRCSWMMRSIVSGVAL
jgi:hypothetical protein